MAGAISSARRISIAATSSPSEPAAARTLPISCTVRALSTLAIIANWRRPGTSSRKRSSRLPIRSVERIDRPVTLPPGRARLATRPVSTGSPAAPNTIGIAVVARFNAMTVAVPDVTMTSTLSWTNSAAISAIRSGRPAAERYSIAIVLPSIQPSLCSCCRKAAARALSAEGVLWYKKPMVRSFAGCCARAVSGHAAAADERDEVAAFHSITSSASCWKRKGTSSPSALAVLRLTTSSYLTGACTGRSAGFSPRRMRLA